MLVSRPCDPERESSPARRGRHGAERRAEPRRPATGDVRLRLSGILAGSFVGQLIDTADSGFRVRHGCMTLTSGQLVDFEYAGGSGRARAVWTRINGSEAETGFHILGAAGE